MADYDDLTAVSIINKKKFILLSYIGRSLVCCLQYDRYDIRRHDELSLNGTSSAPRARAACQLLLLQEEMWLGGVRRGARAAEAGVSWLRAGCWLLLGAVVCCSSCFFLLRLRLYGGEGGAGGDAYSRSGPPEERSDHLCCYDFLEASIAVVCCASCLLLFLILLSSYNIEVLYSC